MRFLAEIDDRKMMRAWNSPKRRAERAQRMIRIKVGGRSFRKLNFDARSCWNVFWDNDKKPRPQKRFFVPYYSRAQWLPDSA